jgi:hypothetical protein
MNLIGSHEVILDSLLAVAESKRIAVKLGSETKNNTAGFTRVVQVKHHSV